MEKLIRCSEIIQQVCCFDSIILLEYRQEKNEYVTCIYMPEKDSKISGHYFKNQTDAGDDFEKRLKEYEIFEDFKSLETR